MLRNWVTQFGFDAGNYAGDERISEADRGKFIGQIGAYFGWTPPPQYNWSVEVTKDNKGEYVMVFMRYATPDEAKKMLGNDFEKQQRSSTQATCSVEPHADMSHSDHTDITPHAEHTDIIPHTDMIK
jgi:hypothetical protein